jgi:2-iminoacetate synthase
MFSQELAAIESQVVSIMSQSPTPAQIEEALSAASKRQSLGLEQIWCLLNLDPNTQRDAYEAVLNLSREIKASIYKNKVFAIVPLYVTSICQEHCIYCNYRAGNKGNQIERIRLTNEQLKQEAQFLIEDKGLRVIELVYATDPMVRIPEICEHVHIVQELLEEVGGGMVGINAEPFDIEDYVWLKENGLDFVVLWQETYQREIYRHLHLGGTKKSNFDYRVDSFERMILGGIKHVGLGVLSGLAPWRLDWLLLIAHERYLQERYGVKPSILGVPRLKPAPGAKLQWTPFIPTDDEYLLAIAVHNIVFPTSLPFINTREAWELCVKASAGGGALFTFDCKTIPGGYTLGVTGCQFPTFSYDARIYRFRLEANGLSPIFDWSFDSEEAIAVERRQEV